MRNLLAAVTLVGILALAQAALAAGTQQQGYRFIADSLGGNEHATQPQGYRFITDTLGGNGGTQLASVATGGNSFNWSDAGIGAAGAIGTALVLIGISLAALRRRGRLASENSRRIRERAAPKVTPAPPRCLTGTSPPSTRRHEMTRSTGAISRGGRWARAGTVVLALTAVAVTASIARGASPRQRLSWTALPPMPTARGGMASAVVGGKIYVVGGATRGEAKTLATLQVYDPQTKLWRTLAPMPTSRNLLGAASLDGEIYAIGGNDGTNALAAVESYNVAAGSWKTDAPLPKAVDFAAATAGAGRVYAVGGVDEAGHSVASLEIYDPATNSWTSGRPMPTARGLAGVTWSDGRLYAIGGYGAGSVVAGNVEAYDPKTNHWQARAPIPNPCTHPAIGTLASGQIIVAGGGPKPAIANVELYTPSSNTWKQLAPLPGAVIPTGAVLGGDTFYVIGGFVGEVGVTAAVKEAVVH